MSIDTEEMVKAQPMDGVVLVRSGLVFGCLMLTPLKIGGCDKVGLLTNVHVQFTY